MRSVSDLVLNDMLAAKGAALITLLLIIGILFAVKLADKVGRISLQVVGFISCAIGTRSLLYILVGTSVLGAIVTWLFRIETTGVSLDSIEQASER